MKKIAILQSNYIPWKGYFDIINLVDVFVIYDTVQYTKNDWRNRNVIKTKEALQWLTIPCRQEFLEQRICDTQLVDRKWTRKHWQAIKTNYSKSKHFNEFSAYFEDLYSSIPNSFLTEVNLHFIHAINKMLNIETQIVLSSDLIEEGDKTERLVNICQQLDGDTYLSGPAAMDYIDESVFKSAGITLEWANYNNYPEYPQLWGDFKHQVSIIDLIFNTGLDASKYMKSFANE